jgi:hypothetical protein
MTSLMVSFSRYGLGYYCVPGSSCNGVCTSQTLTLDTVIVSIDVQVTLNVVTMEGVAADVEFIKGPHDINDICISGLFGPS